MAKIETFLSLIGLFTTLCSPYVSTEREYILIFINCSLKHIIIFFVLRCNSTLPNDCNVLELEFSPLAS